MLRFFLDYKNGYNRRVYPQNGYKIHKTTCDEILQPLYILDFKGGL